MVAEVVYAILDCMEEEDPVDTPDQSPFSAHARVHLESALTDLLAVLQQRLDEHHDARAKAGQESRARRHP